MPQRWSLHNTTQTIGLCVKRLEDHFRVLYPNKDCRVYVDFHEDDNSGKRSGYSIEVTNDIRVLSVSLEEPVAEVSTREVAEYVNEKKRVHAGKSGL